MIDTRTTLVLRHDEAFQWLNETEPPERGTPKEVPERLTPSEPPERQAQAKRS